VYENNKRLQIPPNKKAGAKQRIHVMRVDSLCLQPVGPRYLRCVFLKKENVTSHTTDP